MTYQILLFAHVLCFVYWLGGDLGVFYSSRFVVAEDQPAAARTMALKVMHFLDLIPRICLVLILPIGLSLANTFFNFLSDPQLIVIWVACLCWLVLAVKLYNANGAPWTRIGTPIDLGIRVAVALITIFLAFQAFSGTGVLPRAPWLGIKLLAFATCISCGIAIRLVFRPFGPALAAVMSGSDDGQGLATMQRCLAIGRPFVVGIWVALLIAAWFGLSKTTF